MVGNPDFLTGPGTDSPGFQELETPEGEPHLRFFVPSRSEFALPAIGIREVLFQSPDRMTPIPNVSPLLLGTFNLRGRVIWVADLGQFLGDSTPLNTDRTEIHVIAVEDQDIILGLAVDEVNDMAWLDPDKMQMPTQVSDSMTPFIKGEWQVGTEGSVLRLLDQIAILRSARWAT
ncbi:Chemotaxis protein [Planktothrix sp. PCC 11201]|uniref:chemotaxis protein CheW n=1 Tax=Planktothrix sp. PCC 11201 TaxID=1729650 RepID=UPI00091BB41A|nr:chemotaxis protein CheW [Planktothrix sp. PCC 11201]SKB15452.1 Chemotaxis protein [Planktothrix sp. PCC 11201]